MVMFLCIFSIASKMKTWLGQKLPHTVCYACSKTPVLTSITDLQDSLPAVMHLAHLACQAMTSFLSFSFTYNLMVVPLLLMLSTPLDAVYFEKIWSFFTHMSMILFYIYTILYFTMNPQYICSHDVPQYSIL